MPDPCSTFQSADFYSCTFRLFVVFLLLVLHGKWFASLYARLAIGWNPLAESCFRTKVVRKMPGTGKKLTRRTKDADEMDFDLEHDFAIRLKRANEQLGILREQQEQIEKEQKDLEGLKIETEELEAEKRELTAKLVDGVALLEEAEEDARRKQQEVVETKKEFLTLIREIRMAEKRGRKTDDVRQQMAIESEVVEKAREAFDRSRRKLDTFEGETEEAAEEPEEIYPAIGLSEGFKVGIGFFAAGGLVTLILYILFLIFRT
jgi:cell division protein FtsB